MRETRIGKRIYVHGVPLDTSWFCPYCCATVDTAFVTLGATGSRSRTSARLTRPLITSALPYPQRDVCFRVQPSFVARQPIRLSLVEIPAPQNTLVLCHGWNNRYSSDRRRSSATRDPAMLGQLAI